MIDKVQALEVAIEIISELTSPKSTLEDFKAARDYIFSIEQYIEINTIRNLYQIIEDIKFLNKNFNSTHNTLTINIT